MGGELLLLWSRIGPFPGSPPDPGGPLWIPTGPQLPSCSSSYCRAAAAAAVAAAAAAGAAGAFDHILTIKILYIKIVMNLGICILRFL